jgi:hypothetical protein
LRKVTIEDAHGAWMRAELIKRVADRVVRLGPFSIGIDGLLAPVPVVGTLFSLVAGLWLIVEGVRAGASRFTLTRMVFYIGLRTLASALPIEGWLFDVLFRGHMLAANALQRDIARRFGVPTDAVRRPVSPVWSFRNPAAAT